MLDIINFVVPLTLEKQQRGHEEYETYTRKAMGTYLYQFFSLPLSIPYT
jgi:hypothetical protein